MNLKIPPLIVTLTIGIAMWFVARVLPNVSVQFPLRTALAIGLLLLGLCVMGFAVGLFRKADTTVNPFQPEQASSLVVTGIFSRTRNPMYLGMLLILLGWGVWLANFANIVLVAAFVWFMNRFQIRHEEQALRERFGDTYASYCAKVRRWL